MLLGIAGIAAPIIAHLMSRRTRHRVTFPTIRFLIESSATQSKIYRVRRWMLLMLRCLAVLFLVAAFAQPGCSSRDDVLSSSGDGASVVYVLDTSASLGRMSASGSLLDAMRATVARSLDELKPGEDRVNVVIADAKPHVLFPTANSKQLLTLNLDAVRGELSALKVSSDRADLAKAIALAGQLLENAKGLRRVIVVSDMQRRNWNGVRLADRASSLLPSGTSLTVLPLKTSTHGNVGLHSPRSDPAHALLNRAVNLLVTVHNHATEIRDVSVSIVVDGQAGSTETLRLKPGESREHPFTHSFSNVGLHRVVFSLPDDELEIDNRSFLAVEVSPRVPVFVVGDDDPDELGSSTYFLLRALAPRGDERDSVHVNHITGADLETADIHRAAAVFISDAKAISPAAAKALLSYIELGGGVIWFAGGDTVEANLDQLAEQGGNGAVPMRLGQRVNVGSVGEPAMINEGIWNAPALSEFDPQSRALLQRIRFAVIHDVTSVTDGARVLLKFAGDKPALALQNVGEGRFILANFSPALNAGDLGKYGSFPALVHSLMQFVQPKRDNRFVATVGSPLAAITPVLVGGQTGLIALRGPGEAMLTPAVSRDAQRLFVELSRTESPGFHAVYHNDVKVADIAVNVDQRESDLSAIDSVTLEAALASNGTNIEVASAGVDAEYVTLRGQPVWQWFVVAAMLMIGCEMAILAVWNR